METERVAPASSLAEPTPGGVLESWECAQLHSTGLGLPQAGHAITDTGSHRRQLYKCSSLHPGQLWRGLSWDLRRQSTVQIVVVDVEHLRVLGCWPGWVELSPPTPESSAALKGLAARFPASLSLSVGPPGSGREGGSPLSVADRVCPLGKRFHRPLFWIRGSRCGGRSRTLRGASWLGTLHIHTGSPWRLLQNGGCSNACCMSLL